jgi:hypothetical protein
MHDFEKKLLFRDESNIRIHLFQNVMVVFQNSSALFSQLQCSLQ